MMERIDPFRKVIAISGGCDPPHVGHLRLINHAATYGQVVIILNSDDWLTRKKGYVYMPHYERYELLLGFRNISDVYSVDDSDGTVCEALRRIKPDYFGNGGDRKNDNTPEVELCNELGIKLIWGLGGEKVQSSSELTEEAARKIIKNLKKW